MARQYWRMLVVCLFILMTVTVVTAQEPTAIPEFTLVFDAQPGPDVPMLDEFALNAADDAEIVANVVAYYQANAERLALLWREDNPTRLAGIFAMYISHISRPYGSTPLTVTLTDYISNDNAHCGTYIIPQQQIAIALGLTTRTIEFVGEHAWLEVYVDDHWELFDATTNTWINRAGLELLEGVVRQYRYFYTPMLDINRPDARLHLIEGYDMPRLRERMPLMGITYFPPGELAVSRVYGPLADQLNEPP